MLNGALETTHALHAEEIASELDLVYEWAYPVNDRH
jgi:hypothetical protein